MAKVRSNLKTTRKTFIRAWRNFRRLTLEQVGERVGVTAGALSQLERGEVQYTQPMLEALADALSCEPADLLIRDPRHEAGIMLVWNQIPESDRAQVIEVLKTFVSKGKVSSIL